MTIERNFRAAWKGNKLFPARELICPVLFNDLSPLQVDRVLRMRGFPVVRVGRTLAAIPTEAGKFVADNLDAVRRAICGV